MYSIVYEGSRLYSDISNAFGALQSFACNTFELLLINAFDKQFLEFQ